MKGKMIEKVGLDLRRELEERNWTKIRSILTVEGHSKISLYYQETDVDY